jgi:hypothetical protein
MDFLSAFVSYYDRLLSYTSTLSGEQDSKKDIFIKSIIVTIIPLLLLPILNPFHKTMALSPSFELQEMINENHHWGSDLWQ